MKNNYHHISIVLDRSGSMETIREATIKGLNKFIDDQKALPGECKVTLCQFDDIYEVVYQNKDINSIKPLNFDSFVPRNTTALLDAIGKTINDTGNYFSVLPENEHPEKVIFCIMTDGLENASKDFKRDKIFEMIKHQKEKYNWQFVFLGANQDAIATAASIGIGSNSSITYASSAIGTQNVYSVTSNNILRFRSNSVDNVSFSEEEREESLKTS